MDAASNLRGRTRPAWHPHAAYAHTHAHAHAPLRNLDAAALLRQHRHHQLRRAYSGGSGGSADGASSGSGSSSAASASAAAASAGAGASAGGAALRGLSAVRARPLAHLAAFGAVHVGVAWALVPAVYGVLHGLNLTTTLLAGPQAAYILSRPVPDWVPVPGWRRSGAAGALADGEGEASAKGAKGTHKQRTVEDCLGAAVRASVVAGWHGGAAVYGGVRGLSERLTGSGDPSEGARRAKGALARLAGARSADEAADEAQKALDDVAQNAQRQDAKLKAQGAEKGADKGGPGSWIKGAWKGSVAKHAEDVQFAQVRDAVAAWVLVKALFPLRLPLSAWLTPRTVRFATRAFRRGA